MIPTRLQLALNLMQSVRKWTVGVRNRTLSVDKNEAGKRESIVLQSNMYIGIHLAYNIHGGYKEEQTYHLPHRISEHIPVVKKIFAYMK